MIRLVSDTASAEIEKVVQAMPQLLNVGSYAVRTVLIKHFRDRNNEGSKLGGERTNFWSTVAGSVGIAKGTKRKITVEINNPHAVTHIKGRRIKARNSKYLTIPVHPDGHGKRARTVSGLKIILKKGGKKAAGLGYVEGKGKQKKITMVYAFKKRVKIKRDPRALPSQDTVMTELATAMRDALSGAGDAV